MSKLVKNKSKKGFTLIELLAVIVILAIILLIAVPLVLNIIDDVKKGSLDIIKKNIERVARLYVLSNHDEFLLKDGEKKYIQLETLEDGYISQVVGPNGQKCVGHVKVEKESKNLIYTVYLDCGEGNNLLVESSYINFGGNYLDEFNEIVKTSDGGYIVVGNSNSSKIGNIEKSEEEINYDAIIVKYNKDGIEEWSRNFGGTNHDYFYGVIEDNNGYVAVGHSASQDGDMESLDAFKYNSILVKYDFKGNLINKKIVTGSSVNSSVVRNIIYKDNNYYVIGDGRYVLSNWANLQYIIKYDNNFNEVWKNVYGGENYTSKGNKAIFNSSGNLVLVGYSSSSNEEMTDIKIGAQGNADGVIFTINPLNGEIIEKGIFGGVNGYDYFTDVIEVNDGYIAIGYSNSDDYHMENLNKGGNDAVIVKYKKTAVNNILPLEWVKVVGGSNNDIFNAILLNNNEIVLVGQSNSIDGDLNNITKANNGYYDGLIVKMDMEGNILNKKTYGGSKSDFLNSGIYNGKDYVLVGKSFSIDKNIEPFNFGNSDALMITLDNNLKEVKNFKLETLLMNKPKEISLNYGTSIPLPANRNNLKLYTTNDTTKDLGRWCTSNSYVDPNSNYNNVNCLFPFDSANIKILYSGAIKLENKINIETSKSNWIKIEISSDNGVNKITNFKIKFDDTNEMTIGEAVNAGYLEPLVLGGALSTGNHFFNNSFEILTNGTAENNTYSYYMILLKPKNKLLKEINFNFNRNVLTLGYGINVLEFSDFDISLNSAQ